MKTTNIIMQGVISNQWDMLRQLRREVTAQHQNLKGPVALSSGKHNATVLCCDLVMQETIRYKNLVHAYGPEILDHLTRDEKQDMENIMQLAHALTSNRNNLVVEGDSFLRKMIQRWI